jgi:ABC-type glycerol-3-phosphate transport system substrate-binding protein
MDTLALVYNRSLLDQAGIPTPPATWDDLLSDIPKLRKLNAQGQFLETAVALGGTETTVPHAADIVSLLMLQNGTTMNDDSGLASFANRQDGDLGAKALQFYTDFANPSSDAYTWNAAQGQAMESFLAGKTAMIFAYHSELAAIKERSPFLNIAVAPMPQSVSSTINYPSYSALAVSKRSHAPAWAWDFDIFAATNPAANKAYLDIIQAPPALRSLIAGTRSGELSIFARQNLTASSWQITDYAKMKNIFSGAVNSVVNGQAAPQAALDAAQDQVNNIQ